MSHPLANTDTATRLDQIEHLKQENSYHKQRNTVLEAELVRHQTSADADKTARLVQYGVEAKAYRDTVEKLTTQNMYLRIDLIDISNRLNDANVAIQAAEDGRMKSKVTRYRGERNLARDELKKAEVELGRVRLTSDWSTQDEQAAAIGKDTGFNMYERLKKRLEEVGKQ